MSAEQEKNKNIHQKIIIIIIILIRTYVAQTSLTRRRIFSSALLITSQPEKECQEGNLRFFNYATRAGGIIITRMGPINYCRGRELGREMRIRIRPRSLPSLADMEWHFGMCVMWQMIIIRGRLEQETCHTIMGGKSTAYLETNIYTGCLSFCYKIRCLCLSLSYLTTYK